MNLSFVGKGRMKIISILIHTSVIRNERNTPDNTLDVLKNFYQSFSENMHPRMLF